MLLDNLSGYIMGWSVLPSIGNGMIYQLNIEIWRFSCRNMVISWGDMIIWDILPTEYDIFGFVWKWRIETHTKLNREDKATLSWDFWFWWCFPFVRRSFWGATKMAMDHTSLMFVGWSTLIGYGPQGYVWFDPLNSWVSQVIPKRSSYHR